MSTSFHIHSPSIWDLPLTKPTAHHLTSFTSGMVWQRCTMVQKKCCSPHPIITPSDCCLHWFPSACQWDICCPNPFWSPPVRRFPLCYGWRHVESTSPDNVHDRFWILLENVWQLHDYGNDHCNRLQPWNFNHIDHSKLSPKLIRGHRFWFFTQHCKTAGFGLFCQVQFLPSMAKNMPENICIPSPTPQN